MTVDGDPANLEEAVSWVDALCWFTGWAYPRGSLTGLARAEQLPSHRERST